jgi:hypothetical protein
VKAAKSVTINLCLVRTRACLVRQVLFLQDVVHSLARSVFPVATATLLARLTAPIAPWVNTRPRLAPSAARLAVTVLFQSTPERLLALNVLRVNLLLVLDCKNVSNALLVSTKTKPAKAVAKPALQERTLRLAVGRSAPLALSVLSTSFSMQPSVQPVLLQLTPTSKAAPTARLVLSVPQTQLLVKLLALPV